MLDSFNEVVPQSTTPAPPRLGYNVAVKLTNLGENFALPATGSADYDNLVDTVQSGFKPVLGKVPGFSQLRLEHLEMQVRLITLFLIILFLCILLPSF